jgi:hypothetical protein
MMYIFLAIVYIFELIMYVIVVDYEDLLIMLIFVDFVMFVICDGFGLVRRLLCCVVRLYGIVIICGIFIFVICCACSSYTLHSSSPPPPPTPLSSPPSPSPHPPISHTNATIDTVKLENTTLSLSNFYSH